MPENNQIISPNGEGDFIRKEDPIQVSGPESPPSFIQQLSARGYQDLIRIGQGSRSHGWMATTPDQTKIIIKQRKFNFKALDVRLFDREKNLLAEIEKDQASQFPQFAPRIHHLPGKMETEQGLTAQTYIEGSPLLADRVSKEKFNRLHATQKVELLLQMLKLSNYLFKTHGVHDLDFHPDNYRVSSTFNLTGKVDWNFMLPPKPLNKMIPEGVTTLEALPVEQGRDDLGIPNTIQYRTNAETVRNIYGLIFTPQSSGWGKGIELFPEIALFRQHIRPNTPRSLALLAAPSATPVLADKQDEYSTQILELNRYKHWLNRSVTEHQNNGDPEYVVGEVEKLLSNSSADESENSRRLFNSLRWMIAILEEKNIALPESTLDLIDVNYDYILAEKALKDGDINEARLRIDISHAGLGSLKSLFLKEYLHTDNPSHAALTTFLEVLAGEQSYTTLPTDAQEISLIIRKTLITNRLLTDLFKNPDANIDRTYVDSLLERLPEEHSKILVALHSIEERIHTSQIDSQLKELADQAESLRMPIAKIAIFIQRLEPEESRLALNFNGLPPDKDSSNEKLRIAIQSGEAGSIQHGNTLLKDLLGDKSASLSKSDKALIRTIQQLKIEDCPENEIWTIAFQLRQILVKSPLIEDLTHPKTTMLARLITMFNSLNSHNELKGDSQELFQEFINSIQATMNELPQVKSNTIRLVISPEQYS